MEVSGQDFREVQTLIRSLCGLVLSDDKTYLVQTRLESVVRTHGFSSFAQYLDRLQQPDATLMRDELVETLTTGETSFNRDGHPFECLRRTILPELGATIRARRKAGYPAPIARLWSAGCSTGQETYSMAMAVCDYLAIPAAHDLRPDCFPILATDVSDKSLKIAREGIYPLREIDRGLTLEQRNRFFRPQSQSDKWCAADEIRRMIEFRHLNFIETANDVGSCDVIFCRNVMIYFDAATRQRLCEQFHRILSPDGFLIVGAAESLYGLKTDFVSQQVGRTTVYRKCPPGAGGERAT